MFKCFQKKFEIFGFFNLKQAFILSYHDTQCKDIVHKDVWHKHIQNIGNKHNETQSNVIPHMTLKSDIQ